MRGVLHAGVEGVLEVLPHWELAGEPVPSDETAWAGGFAIEVPVSLRVRRIVPFPAR